MANPFKPETTWLEHLAILLLSQAEWFYRLWVLGRFYEWHVRARFHGPALTIWNLWVGGFAFSLLFLTTLTRYEEKKREASASAVVYLVCAVFSSLFLLIAWWCR